ncbi:hypothetical protein [Georgenia deserti]|uniref:Histidinol dehydrogenase n=1 Tax=Georgenia deserti TaxID=2093781 RepID=A0ABW4L4U2_9MICO
MSTDAPVGIAAHVAAVVVGVLVGLCGTLAHRWGDDGLPEGLLFALLLVLLGGLFARAAADRAGMVLYLLTAVVVVLGLTFLGPGRDVLVTDDLVSRIWLLGAPVAGAAAALMPRSLFSDRPRGTREDGRP